MLRVELPFPSPELMPNRKNGKHWTAANDAKVAARDTGYIVTKKAAGHQNLGLVGFLPLTLTFHAPDNRRRDLDNLLAAMKSALDGVALALVTDDRFFEPVTLKRGEVRKGGAVVLEVGHAV